ncbi:MAG: hypothetical protein ACI4TM_10420 [Candidatus Cryptobacteroides sp.]
MNKCFHSILAVTVMSLFTLTSCSEKTIGLANKGKERPEVEFTRGTSSTQRFSFTLTPSENAAYYGYCILEGDDNTPPTPYQIITKTVENAIRMGVYKVEDYPEKEVTAFCTASESYQVFSVAMTESGLLGYVVDASYNIQGAVPFELVTGNYTMSGSPVDDAMNEYTGYGFSVVLSRSGNSYTTYELSGTWFGCSDVSAISLVGTLDPETNSLVFNGNWKYGSELITDSIYGMPLVPSSDYKYIYTFFGGGLSRMEKITAFFNEDSELTSITEFSIDLYACEIQGEGLAMGDYVGLFDSMVNGKLVRR